MEPFDQQYETSIIKSRETLTARPSLLKQIKETHALGILACRTPLANCSRAAGAHLRDCSAFALVRLSASNK